MPKRSDKPLLDSQQQVRLLIEGSEDCTLLILDPHGVVVSSVSNADRVSGFAADDIKGRYFSFYYSSEDIARFKPEDDLRTALRDGRLETITTRQHRGGSSFCAKVVITPIRDWEGTLLGFGNVTRDISALVHDAELLRRGEEEAVEGAGRMRAVVETAGDGIILIDALGLVQMFNPACERIFGYSAGEVRGQTVEVLMPAWLVRGAEAGSARKNIVNRGEVAGVRKDGAPLTLELSISEVRQDGACSFVGVIRDITERKRVDAQLIQAQKMEAVGQLSGGIAHDFNNLLTVILGNGDLLCAGLKQQPELRHLSEMIVSAGERGAELTQRLLAFSRRQTLRPVAMDCNEHVERMHELMRRTLRENIEIQLTLDPMLNSVLADPAQLESAILNLALNAQDAMPNGGRLSIATSNAVLGEHRRENHQEVKPGKYVLVSVTDNGEGMSPEVLEQAFQPFFTTKDVGKGSGLGLSMVFGFAKQSEGHVSLSSEPGQGTIVRLYLPSTPSTAKVVAASVKRDGARMSGSETVLLVEDDPHVSTYARGCLESLGYSVISAGSAAEALALLDLGAAPHLLFTDVVMPGAINGWELAARARRIKPNLKVLMTSGYPLDMGEHQDVDTLILGKPYRNSELAQRLRETLDAAA